MFRRVFAIILMFLTWSASAATLQDLHENEIFLFEQRHEGASFRLVLQAPHAGESKISVLAFSAEGQRLMRWHSTGFQHIENSLSDSLSTIKIRFKKAYVLNRLIEVPGGWNRIQFDLSDFSSQKSRLQRIGPETQARFLRVHRRRAAAHAEPIAPRVMSSNVKAHQLDFAVDLKRSKLMHWNHPGPETYRLKYAQTPHGLAVLEFKARKPGPVPDFVTYLSAEDLRVELLSDPSQSQHEAKISISVLQMYDVTMFLPLQSDLSPDPSKPIRFVENDPASRPVAESLVSFTTTPATLLFNSTGRMFARGSSSQNPFVEIMLSPAKPRCGQLF